MKIESLLQFKLRSSTQPRRRLLPNRLGLMPEVRHQTSQCSQLTTPICISVSITPPKTQSPKLTDNNRRPISIIRPDSIKIRLGNMLRRSHKAHAQTLRAILKDLLLLLLAVAQLIPQLRDDQPRHNGVDADPLLGQLVGQRLRDGDQPAVQGRAQGRSLAGAEGGAAGG